MSSESEGRRRRTPIWAEPQRGRRRPSVTREQIAETALWLADHDGIEAVSLRRIAGELGVGTMTLYHYVRTKDDLYELMGDTIMGELLVPADAIDAQDWRSSIAAIGRSSREAFRRHPWMVRAVDLGGEIGPNGMRHFEQSLAAVEGTGLGASDRMQLVALVDDYVFGHSLRAIQEEAELRNAEWQQNVESYVERQLATGDYPHIEALLGDGDRHEAWETLVRDVTDAERFEMGLQVLLDGLERWVEARRR
jgi:AcrR family transcriptional regulator